MDTLIRQLMPNSLQDQIPHLRNDINVNLTGTIPRSGEALLVWGHGWQRDHLAFAGLIAGLPRFAHLALDFPGFGRSPQPQSVWGTADYADAVAKLIEPYHRMGVRVVWIGHSFGGRVGLQLAGRYPDLIERMCIIAGAGLPRKRDPAAKLNLRLRTVLIKSLTFLMSILGRSTEQLKLRFGSADYRNAGTMRPIFVRVVNEDLTSVSRQIVCPVLLIYGANDTETPPEIGQRLAKIIAKSELSVLQHQDHYSVLEGGRHLVLKRLIDFLGPQ